jgi:hypothetical protein
MGRSREPLVFTRFGRTSDEPKVVRVAGYAPKRLPSRRRASRRSRCNWKCSAIKFLLLGVGPAVGPIHSRDSSLSPPLLARYPVLPNRRRARNKPRETDQELGPLLEEFRVGCLPVKN